MEEYMNKKDRCDDCDKIARFKCRECDALYCEKHAEAYSFECQNHDPVLEPYNQ